MRYRKCYRYSEFTSFRFVLQLIRSVTPTVRGY